MRCDIAVPLPPLPRVNANAVSSNSSSDTDDIIRCDNIQLQNPEVTQPIKMAATGIVRKTRLINMLKQTKLWYLNRISIDRSSNSGIGLGSKVIKMWIAESPLDKQLIRGDICGILKLIYTDLCDLAIFVRKAMIFVFIEDQVTKIYSTALKHPVV